MKLKACTNTRCNRLDNDFLRLSSFVFLTAVLDRHNGGYGLYRSMGAEKKKEGRQSREEKNALLSPGAVDI